MHKENPEIVVPINIRSYMNMSEKKMDKELKRRYKVKPVKTDDEIDYYYEKWSSL